MSTENSHRRFSLRKEYNSFSADDEGDEDVFNSGKRWRRKSAGCPLNSKPTQQDKTTSISSSRESLMDGLLWDLYDRWNAPQRNGSADSDTLTEGSSLSEAWQGRAYHNPNENNSAQRLTRANLQNKDVTVLKQMVRDLRHTNAIESARLVRQLKRRERRLQKLQKNYDIVTAILQASSLKRRIDTRIRFSIAPMPGDDAFQQWRDAMKSVARLSNGVPLEFRKNIWLSLADKYLADMKLDWEKTKKFAFNERTNPDDGKLGMQIVKDLHRTGCSGFNGQANELDRAMLKRVLLAYARWNKRVGYCQGFNVIAALILDVMDRKEDDTLKVMILLIDHVLPESYFADNLKALSVDMAVFRDLLHIHLPQLSKHLDYLQAAARDHTTGANYEPPLTNVFTMQWFLTLFGTSLPKATALRVWDSVFLEGSEILLRTALAIWTKIQHRIMAVQSADEFYTTMGQLTSEMLDDGITDADQLIKMIYSQSVFPMPHLDELREKYTYNITPFSSAMSTGRRPNTKQSGAAIFSDDDEIDEEELAENINCFAGVFVPNQARVSPNKSKPIGESECVNSGSSFDISKATPGAWAATPEANPQPQQRSSAYQERMSLDLDTLKHQYKRLRQRQKQAHIILTNAAAEHKKAQTPLPTPNIVMKRRPTKPMGVVAPPMESPVAVNHLFLGRKNVAVQQKNQHVTNAPNIAPLKIRQKPDTVMATATVPMTAKPEGITGTSDGKSGDVKAVDANDNVEHVTEDLLLMDINDTLNTESPTKDSGCEISLDNSTATSGVSSDSLLSEVEGKVPESVPETVPEDADGMEVVDTKNSSEHSTATQDDLVSDSTVSAQSDDVVVKQNGVHCNGDTIMNGDQENVTECVDNVEKSQTKRLTLLAMAETHKSQDENNTSTEIEDVLHRKMTAKESDENNKINNNNKMHKNNEMKNVMTNGVYNNHPVSVSPGVKSVNSNSQRNVRNTKESSQKTIPIPPSIPQKKFNPFPRQAISKSRSEAGLKLGLYSAESLAELESNNQQQQVKTGNIKTIGRAQINACLHRQYMAGVKQQGKSLRQK